MHAHGIIIYLHSSYCTSLSGDEICISHVIYAYCSLSEVNYNYVDSTMSFV